jgi:hypothetical protein
LTGIGSGGIVVLTLASPAGDRQMAKFIVNAEKKYLAKMTRSYQLEVDEAEVIGEYLHNNKHD